MQKSKTIRKSVTVNYSGAQPRDNQGRWSSGGGGGAMSPDTGGGLGGGKTPVKWSNSHHKMAKDISGETPDDASVESMTLYHVTKRENLESIRQNGLTLDKVDPRWENDYAVSLADKKSDVKKFFGKNFDGDKLAVLRVKIKGVFAEAGTTSWIKSRDAKDYTRQLVSAGYDGQVLGGGTVYVNNPKSILSIEEVD